MKKHLALAVISAALMLSPTQVVAQDRLDISEQDATSTVRYLLPLILRQIHTQCTPHLASDGFMATGSDMLLAKYSEDVDAHWPTAKQVLITMGEEKTPGSTAMLIGIPDEAVRPLIDTMIPSILLEDLEPENCALIERTLELIEPLPADNIAALGGLYFVVAQEDSAR